MARIVFAMVGLSLCILLFLQQRPSNQERIDLEVVLPVGHSDQFSCLALNRSGKLALTGSRDETAILWDTDSGRVIRSFVGQGPVNNVALSDNGLRVLMGSSEQYSAILWDALTGKKIHTFAGHTRDKNNVTNSYSVTMSRDGMLVLSGADDKKAILWDASTGKAIRTFEEEGAVGCVSLSRDGKYALIGSSYSTNFRDVQTGEVLQAFEDQGFVRCVELSDDGSRALITGSKSIILWNTSTGEKLRSFDQMESSWYSALSGDGQKVLTESSDTTATLWIASTGEKLGSFNSEGTLRRSALSRDGTRLVTGSSDKTATVWDVKTGNKHSTISSINGMITGVALSTEGRCFLTGAFDKTASLWDIASGQRTHSIAGHTEAVLSVALSSDGKRALTGSFDNSAILWDTLKGTKLSTMDGHTKGVSFTNYAESRPTMGVRSVALSRDGLRAVTGSTDKNGFLWASKTGEKLRTFSDHSQNVMVSISDNGNRILTCSSPFAYLWNANTGKKLHTFQHPESNNLDFIEHGVISRDGKHALTGGLRGNAVLWDADSGKMISHFAGHTRPITTVALSSNAQRVLTGSVDKTVILCDISTGNKVTFSGHSDRVTGVAIDDATNRVISTSYDGTIRIWDAKTGMELAAIIPFKDGKNWIALSPEGLFDGTPDAVRFFSYRIKGTVELVSLEQYRKQFQRPGLLAAIWNGSK